MQGLAKGLRRAARGGRWAGFFPRHEFQQIPQKVHLANWHRLRLASIEPLLRVIHAPDNVRNMRAYRKFVLSFAGSGDKVRSTKPSIHAVSPLISVSPVKNTEGEGMQLAAVPSACPKMCR